MHSKSSDLVSKILRKKTMRKDASTAKPKYIASIPSVRRARPRIYAIELLIIRNVPIRKRYRTESIIILGMLLTFSEPPRRDEVIAAKAERNLMAIRRLIIVLTALKLEEYLLK